MTISRLVAPPNDDLLAPADGVADPRREQIPDPHALVAQEPIDLLDGVLVGEPARLRQRMADHRHGELGAGHDPERAVGQRQHPFGMQVLGKHTADEITNGFNAIDGGL